MTAGADLRRLLDGLRRPGTLEQREPAGTEGLRGTLRPYQREGLAWLRFVTGLNLTGASHVIHFDRWWNPAVENQATDRAFRIGQRRNVLVHKFIIRGTVEERLDAMIADKPQMAEDVLGGEQEVSLTELPDDELLDLVRLDVISAAV